MNDQHQDGARTEPKDGLSHFVQSNHGDLEEWFCCVYCGLETRSHLSNILNHTLRSHFREGLVCNEVLDDGSLCPEKFISPEARNDHRVEVHDLHPPGYQYRPDKKKLRILRGPSDLAAVSEFLADLERGYRDDLRIFRTPSALGYVLHLSPGMGLPYYRKEGLRVSLLPTANFRSRMGKGKYLSISEIERELVAREMQGRLWAIMDVAIPVSPESEASSHKLVYSSHVVPNSRRPVSYVSAGPTESSSSFDDSFDAAVAVLTGDHPEGTSHSHACHPSDEIQQDSPSNVHGYYPYRALAPPKAPQSQSQDSSVSLFGPFSPSLYGRALEDETH